MLFWVNEIEAFCKEGNNVRLVETDTKTLAAVIAIRDGLVWFNSVYLYTIDSQQM